MIGTVDAASFEMEELDQIGVSAQIRLELRILLWYVLRSMARHGLRISDSLSLSYAVLRQDLSFFLDDPGFLMQHMFAARILERSPSDLDRDIRIRLSPRFLEAHRPALLAVRSSEFRALDY